MRVRNINSFKIKMKTKYVHKNIGEQCFHYDAKGFFRLSKKTSDINLEESNATSETNGNIIICFRETSFLMLYRSTQNSAEKAVTAMQKIEPILLNISGKTSALLIKVNLR